MYLFMNESKLWKQELGLLIGREEQLGHSFTIYMTENPVLTVFRIRIIMMRIRFQDDPT